MHKTQHDELYVESGKYTVNHPIKRERGFSRMFNITFSYEITGLQMSVL